MRDGTIFVLEGVSESFYLRVSEAKVGRRLAPGADRALHVTQHRRGTQLRKAEVRRRSHQRIDGGCRPCLLTDPRLQLAHPTGKRIHVECRRERPEKAFDVQEGVVLEVVIDVGDEDRERNPTLKFLEIGRCMQVALSNHVGNLRVCVIACLA